MKHPTKRGALVALAIGAAALALPLQGAGAAEEGSAPGWLSNTGIARAATEGSASGGQPSTGTGETTSIPASAKDLRAVTPASAGPEVSTESVIGVDRRTRVTPATSYPARATVFIVFNNGSSCTGFFVGPDTIATAGHCVHRGGGGSSRWYSASSYSLYPGRDGSSIPYRCSNGTVAKAKRLWSNSNWVNSGTEGFDYGAIESNCTYPNAVPRWSSPRPLTMKLSALSQANRDSSRATERTGRRRTRRRNGIKLWVMRGLLLSPKNRRLGGTHGLRQARGQRSARPSGRSAYRSVAQQYRVPAERLRFVVSPPLCTCV